MNIDLGNSRESRFCTVTTTEQGVDVLKTKTLN